MGYILLSSGGKSGATLTSHANKDVDGSPAEGNDTRKSQTHVTYYYYFSFINFSYAVPFKYLNELVFKSGHTHFDILNISDI